jgi:hypothetical protein
MPRERGYLGKVDLEDGAEIAIHGENAPNVVPLEFKSRRVFTEGVIQLDLGVWRYSTGCFSVSTKNAPTFTRLAVILRDGSVEVNHGVTSVDDED